MSALGRLPFGDYADPDPNRLPLDGNAEPCGACNAEEGEDCRPWCLGRAAVDDETHTGPVRVAFHARHVTVMCPLGHVVTGRALGPDWGGSDLEARIGAHQTGSRPWVVTCGGAL